VIAALALGLVLTYRASGVVNFAHAAVGMYVAFAYYELRQSGELVLPVLGLPDRVPIVDRPTVLTALVTCTLLAAACGILIHGLVFRPLRDAPALGRVVASLGLFLYVQALVDLRFRTRGGTTFQIASMLPEGSVRIGGVVVFTDRFVLAGLVTAATALLWAAFRWTRVGLATRAAAASEKGALLTGLAPDRLAALNWAVATALGGVAVVLAAPIAGLDPGLTSLLIVPALAAALLGGLSGFWATLAAGLGIGMLQAGISRFATTADWLPDWVPKGGLQQGLPFLAILAAMTWRGSSLPTRGMEVTDHHQVAPPVSRSWPLPLVVATAGTIGLLGFGSEWRLGLIVSMVSAVLCLSYVVVTGFVGQISLAQLAIAGVAGFLTARLGTQAGIPFPLAPALAVLAAGAVGVLAGVPALRIRGMTLAIATLAFATTTEELVFKSSAFTAGLGGTTVPRPELFGLDLGIQGRGDAYPRVAFGFLVLGVLVALIVVALNLRRAGTGRRWLAVRANERAAAAAGIDVRLAKLSAFAWSAVFAGAGGVLLAYQRTELSVQSFVVVQSLALLALVYVAGIGSVTGALVAGALSIGGIVTAVLGTGGGRTAQYQFAVTGVALILSAIHNPQGLVGALHSWRQHRRARRRAPEPVEAAG